MKNKYIFLIIAVVLAAYFLMRPQVGTGNTSAQILQIAEGISINCGRAARLCDMLRK